MRPVRTVIARSVLFLLAAAVFCRAAETPLPCATLLDRMDDSSSTSLRELVESRAFRRFYGNPELRPIVEGIAKLGSLDFEGSFSLEGHAREKDGTLFVTLDGIGPRRGTTRTSSVKDAKISHMGIPTVFQRSDGPNFTLIKAMTAVVEGIDLRLRENPDIKRIVITGKDIANPHLQTIMMDKFGFRIIGYKTAGMGMSLSTVQLEIELKPR